MRVQERIPVFVSSGLQTGERLRLPFREGKEPFPCGLCVMRHGGSGLLLWTGAFLLWFYEAAGSVPGLGKENQQYKQSIFKQG